MKKGNLLHWGYQCVIIIATLDFFTFSHPCQSIITSQLSSVKFKCVNGCVVIEDQEDIYVPSITLIDMIDSPIISCIVFNSINTLRIDSIILSNFVLNLPLSSSTSFFSITNTHNFIAASVQISYVSMPTYTFSQEFAILNIDSSVTQTQITSLSLEGDVSMSSTPLLNQTIIRLLSQSIEIQILYQLGFQENGIISCESELNIDTIYVDISMKKTDLDIWQMRPLTLQSETSISLNSIIFMVQSQTTYQQANNIQIIPFNDQIKIERRFPMLTIGLSVFGVNQEGFSVFNLLAISLIPVEQMNNNLYQLKSSNASIAVDMNPETQPKITINQILPQKAQIQSQKIVDESIFIHFFQLDSVHVDLIQVTNIKERIIDFSEIRQLIVQNIESINPPDAPLLKLPSRIIKSSNITEMQIGRFIASNILINEDFTLFELANIKMFQVNQTILENISIQQSRIYDFESVEKISILNSRIININMIQSSTNSLQPLIYFDFCGEIIIDDFKILHQYQSFQASSNRRRHRRMLSTSRDFSRILSNRIIGARVSQEIQLNEVFADLSGMNIGFFEADDGLSSIHVTNSIFLDCYASLNGGCLNFRILSNKYTSSLDPKLYFSNCTFTRATSGFFGGAINGFDLISAKDSRFEHCKSLIGGAIYLRKKSNGLQTSIQNLTFIENTASMVDSDICFGVDEIQKSNVFEYNPNLQGTYMYLNPIGEYSSKMEFYAGILYIYQLKILINGRWFSALNQDTSSEIDGNLYSFVDSVTYLQNQQISQASFLYLLFDPMDLSDWDVPKQLLSFSFIKDKQKLVLDYRTSSNCTSNMETINFSNGQNKICAYCGFTKAFNQLTNACESCDMNYFSLCYVNQTFLRAGYWRSNFTMNTTLIETCSIAPSSCNSGNGTGNSLCYTGHIGAQCLNCDIRGEYWGESYSVQGVFSCNKCSQIGSNNMKIIFGFALITASLLLIIKGNVKATQNQIYADYLSRIRMVYIGSSLNRMQSTSTLVKVLLFNVFFTNLANSFVKFRVWTSLQEISVVFSQPLMSQFFSLDCFLVSLFSSNLNLGFANLVVAVAIPGSIMIVILVIAIVVMLLNPKYTRTVVSTLPLAFTYLYLIAFYPFILELCLKSMHCLRLSGKQSFALIDLSLECKDSETNGEVNPELQSIRFISIPILIIFVLIVPLSTLGILYSQRKRLRQVGMMLTLGFLYQEYKENLFLWEFVRILLKSICVFVQVSLFGDPQLYGSIITLLLVVYLIVLAIVHPFKGKQFSRLEQISVLIQILSVQSAIQFQKFELNEQLNENGTIVKILFLSSQILNIVFVLWLSILILIAFFQKQLMKLVRKHSMPWLEPYLPLYSKKLRKNMKTFRDVVQKLKGNVRSIPVDELKSLLKFQENKYENEPFLDTPPILLTELLSNNQSHQDNF